MKRQTHTPAKRPSYSRRSRSLVLSERCVAVCNRPVLYALLAESTDRYGTLFWIRVRQPHHSRTLPIGNDCRHALSCFERLVRGRVTVYTLADVLYDLRQETP